MKYQVYKVTPAVGSMRGSEVRNGSTKETISDSTALDHTVLTERGCKAGPV